MRKYGAAVLQYDPSEGLGPLREALVDHVADKGVGAAATEILVTSGSQGALDALAMVLICILVPLTRPWLPSTSVAAMPLH